jgi:hypothetical protein
MHHAQENQHPQRLPGLRIHTRCILSENTRSAMACRCIRCTEPCRNILSQESMYAPSSDRHTPHTPTTISSLPSPRSHLLLYPTTVSLHSQIPHMHLPHGALMFPFPSVLSSATPSKRTIPRFSVCDSRRCRVDSMLRRGVEVTMPCRFGVTQRVDEEEGMRQGVGRGVSVGHMSRHGSGGIEWIRGHRAQASTSQLCQLGYAKAHKLVKEG